MSASPERAVGSPCVSPTEARKIARAETRRLLVRRVLRPAFALLGVGALAALVVHVGAAALLDILVRSARFLPLVLLLEALRLLAEAGSTSVLYANGGGRLPFVQIVRAQLIGYPAAALMPAGRAAGEALKATALAPLAGGARATAVATSNQSLALFSGCLISLPCLAAAFVKTGLSPLTVALGVHALVAAAAAIAIVTATRRRSISGFILGRITGKSRVTRDYQEALEAHSALPLGPLGFLLVSRLIQTAQLGVLLWAVGGPLSVEASFLAGGVNLVGASLGDLIPLQIGATDGVFVLAAPTLGISAANAVAVSVLARAVLVTFSFVGALVPLLWPPVAAREAPDGGDAAAAPRSEPS